MRPSFHPVADGLPLAHRLTILYLALPVAVWLASWFAWWIGVPAALALVLALAPVFRGPCPVSISRRHVVLALIALAWVLSVPAGGLFGGEAGDWIGNRSIFLDLGRGGWPTYITDHLWDEAPLLRYYLGYFLVPAALGRWFGASALNWAVPLWTWIGVALLMHLFTRNLATTRAAVVAAAVLILFSGMDAVAYLLRHALFGIGPLSSREFFVVGWDWAYGPNVSNSYRNLDYQSHAKTIGNSPHHFLAAGLGVLLLISLRGQRRFLAASGVVLVACLFWSPLTTAGLLPLATALAVGKGLRAFLTWQNLVVAPVVGGLIVLYLTGGGPNLTTAWLSSWYESGHRLAADLALAYGGEFLLLALLLWRLRPAIVRDPLFVASLAVLLFAPWWCVGDTPGFSDLLLRLPLGPLLLLCYYATHTLLRDRRRDGQRTPVAAWGMAAILVAGMPSATAWYIQYYLAAGSAEPYEKSARSLMIDIVSLHIAQRTIAAPSGLLGTILRDHEHRGGPHGEVLFQSVLQPLDTLFFWENQLLFVTREHCEATTARYNRFLLRFSADERTAEDETYYDVQDFGFPYIHHR